MQLRHYSKDPRRFVAYLDSVIQGLVRNLLQPPPCELHEDCRATPSLGQACADKKRADDVAALLATK